MEAFKWRLAALTSKSHMLYVWLVVDPRNTRQKHILFYSYIYFYFLHCVLVTFCCFFLLNNFRPLQFSFGLFLICLRFINFLSGTDRRNIRTYSCTHSSSFIYTHMYIYIYVCIEDLRYFLILNQSGDFLKILALFDLNERLAALVC